MNPSRLVSHSFFVPFSIQIILAYEWLSSGLEKVRGGQFIPSIGKSLARFENGNPHEWYARSVLDIAKNHPTAFGILVQWGEVLVGVGLLVALALYAFSRRPSFKSGARSIGIAALLGGAFMNLNFYFAAGWTSSSTGGLNACMFWIEILALVAWMVLPKKPAC